MAGQTAVYSDVEQMAMRGERYKASSFEAFNAASVTSTPAAKFGCVMTYNTDGTGTVRAGGTGAIAGILGFPKQHISNGVGANPLASTFQVPDGTAVTLWKAGYPVVEMKAAFDVGDSVIYLNADGEIYPHKTTCTFTASQSTTVLTVASIGGGMTKINLRAGSKITTTGGTFIGTITSVGTIDANGVGTYNMDTSATVGSTTMTAENLVPTGYTLLPGAHVVDFKSATADKAAILVNGGF